MKRRTCIRTLVAGTVGMLSLASVNGQSPVYPTRPITIVVPYSAGGAGDAAVRAIADELSRILGQPIVVESRPGGNTNIGTQYVARSKPDGYTWLMMAPSFTANPSLYEGIWDPVKDFVGVGKMVTTPNVVTVQAKLPVNSLQEFVAWVKKSPTQVNYGNPGIGTSLHLNTELLKLAAGIELTSIPYKGQPPAIIDLLRGDLSVVFATVGQALPHILSGKLKPLAVVSQRRTAQLPEVPTLAEAGYPQANVVPWYGLVVPAATPPDISKRINDAVNKALLNPEVRDRFSNIGMDVESPHSISQVNAAIRADYEKYRDVIRRANIRME